MMTEAQHNIRNIQLEVDGMKRTIRKLQDENRELRNQIGMRCGDMSFRRM